MVEHLFSIGCSGLVELPLKNKQNKVLNEMKDSTEATVFWAGEIAQV